MMIKAILRDGRVPPLDPLPLDWVDGQELVIEPPAPEGHEFQVSEWAQDLEAAAARLPADDHDRFQKALSDIERESKDSVRREWGLP